MDSKYTVGMLQTCMLTVFWLVSVVLVGGCIEEDNGENIEIPHAVDPCEKGTVDLESVVSPVPVTFTDLVKNKKIWNILKELNRVKICK